MHRPTVLHAVLITVLLVTGSPSVAQDVTDNRHRSKLVERNHFRAQPVVDVVRVIGDVVGNGANLRLRARISRELEVLELAIVRNGAGDAVGGVAGSRPPGLVEQRTVVLCKPFQHFPTEVEAIEGGVAALEPRYHRERLRIVIETAMVGEAMVERTFAGVTERRMTEIVCESASLGQVFVKSERTGERARDLGHLQGVGQPGAVMIALVVDEDLRLVGETPESRRVDDPVAIPAKSAAPGARRLLIQAAPAGSRIRREDCACAGRLYRHRDLIPRR